MVIADTRTVVRRCGLALGCVALAVSCAGAPAPPRTDTALAGGASVGFVNRVWQIRASSSAAPGELYVFLADGTLVMTSPNTKPSLGTWTYKDGAFTMTEEGISYRVDILELTSDTFRLRSHNPGEPVEITFGIAETVDVPAVGGPGGAERERPPD